MPHLSQCSLGADTGRAGGAHSPGAHEGHWAALAACSHTAQHSRAAQMPWRTCPGVGFLLSGIWLCCRSNTGTLSWFYWLGLLSANGHKKGSNIPLAFRKQLRVQGASDSLGRLSGLEFFHFWHAFMFFRHSVPTAVDKEPGHNPSGAQLSVQVQCYWSQPSMHNQRRNWGREDRGKALSGETKENKQPQ